MANIPQNKRKRLRHMKSRKNHVTISPGNETKIGNIANVSLLPIVTCVKNVPCSGDCYACKSLDYPSCKDAWEKNTRLVVSDMSQYFADVQEGIDFHKTRFFRWHVGGDIPNRVIYRKKIDGRRYLRGMEQVAIDNPAKLFLAFTKVYPLLRRRANSGHGGRGVVEFPPNLTIVASAWPGYPLPKFVLDRFPIAWLRDVKNPDPRIPDDAIDCPGNCEQCGMCYRLPNVGRDVVFDKH